MPSKPNELDILFPDGLRAIMYKCSAYLGMDKPFPITEETLRDCYQSLERTVQHYPKIPLSQQLQYKEDRLRTLGNTEFQAGWHVLRVTGHQDDLIKAMHDEVRRATFLGELYAHPSWFSFFPPREEAIVALDGIGFIDIQNYRL